MEFCKKNMTVKAWTSLYRPSRLNSRKNTNEAGSDGSNIEIGDRNSIMQ